ncbi:MAG: phosphotransferase [Xanthomonadales bacterium]|jgi:Ser/Thr protein kinase RdoA (MazF antagonist)|nr:phosphotransferase [Xanthomonadales bacterium]
MNYSLLEEKTSEVLFRYYGLEGSLFRLGGENLNYRLSTAKGENYVLKIVGDNAPPESADLEFRLLEHARNAGFPIRLPFIIKNYSKQIETRIKLPVLGSRRLRLISFIGGSMLENISDISTILLKSVGRSLAMFDKAIEDFDHPAAHLGHDWELLHAGRHRQKLPSIDDPELSEQLAWAFDLWQDVREDLPDLPQQVIHGDANKENILVAGESVVGLVDFGDACFNPRICDLAICLAYVMMDRDDPMAAAAVVIGAYNDEIELSEKELAVLFPLVYGRLAVSICMATSRKSENPANTNWFASLEPALRLLRHLYEMGL